MDLDESTDVLMHDDDEVIVSTEPQTQIIEASKFKPEESDSDDDVTDLDRPARPPLKGAGVKRDEDVFDYNLTKREYAPQPPKFDSLPYSSSQTGLVYDVRMRFHVEAVPTDDDIHPEDPRRIHVIFEELVKAGLAFKKDVVPASNYLMGRIDARMVTEEEVRLVHTKDHYDWIQSIAKMTDHDFEEPEQHPGHKMDSIYLSRQTPFCAGLSAGGAIEACRAVMLGKVKNVFAVIRPPGHHAEREDAKGFCFYDNVSIATKVCQREFGEKCRKVFILDWDVHHGNGIQQANYDDPNVLYISLHVHEKGRFYPECSYRDQRGPYGDHLHCGASAGLGKNINIPWSKRGMGDADYVYAFQQIVMPIATEFNPDLVIIAAGFDAAEGDMLGGCNVTPAGYAHMTHMLMSLAQGRLAVCLEGGYNLESISKSAVGVGRTLMGEPPERLINTTPTISGVDDIKLVLRQQSRFWSSLYPKDPASGRLAGPMHGERMDSVVRKWQSATLWDEYEMTTLFVLRDDLSKPFNDRVLATPNYTEARPLLVILHDPPELIASPDPRTGVIELHNTWLTDIVKSYVDWAAKQGFAVIDVNLPKHVSEPEESDEHTESDNIDSRTSEATQLLAYLWDNYIELNESTQVFLMGTNTGHGAIINFIKANEDRVRELLVGAISFVEDVPLMSCKSSTDDMLAPWYFNSSLVFVTPDHQYFSNEIAKKKRKRFGNVTESTQDTITDMLIEHKQTVFDFMIARTEGWRAKRPKDDEDEVMSVTAAEQVSPPKAQMPPIGNFAPLPRAGTNSPRQHASASSAFTSPRAGHVPAVLNFALSPRERPPRSPAR